MFANEVGSRNLGLRARLPVRDVRCRLLAECLVENGVLVCSVAELRGKMNGGT